MNRSISIPTTEAAPDRHVAGMVRRSLLPFIALALFLAFAGYTVMRGEQRARQCTRQLQHIYLALELHEIDHGALPHMAFYPNDPRHSSDSMLVVLDPYALTGAIGLCPGDHDVVRAHGLSYIWNANLNGQTLQEQDPNTWLVAELSALSDEVPAPHLGRYLTLYADGRVVRSRKPPVGLTEIRP